MGKPRGSSNVVPFVPRRGQVTFQSQSFVRMRVTFDLQFGCGRFTPEMIQDVIKQMVAAQFSDRAASTVTVQEIG